MVFISALGIAMLLTSNTWLQVVLKIAGAAYMLYLAFKIVFSNQNVEHQETATPITFIQAALFQWVNPKAWMMLISAVGVFGSNNMGYTVALEAFGLEPYLLFLPVFLVQ